jgi:RNA polymerase sigma factor (sigma-70 family)
MYSVGRPNEVTSEMSAEVRAFDIEAAFRVHYARVARIIGRVVCDRGRAEELAVEVFLKLWRTSAAQGEQLDGWLYRVAARTGLDELRKQKRRARYEAMAGFLQPREPPVTPEEVRNMNQEQHRVRTVLGTLPLREAELLVLRSQGFSYNELASTLGVNWTSIGTLLSRAHKAFRKEYIKRYGQE